MGLGFRVIRGPLLCFPARSSSLNLSGFPIRVTPKKAVGRMVGGQNLKGVMEVSQGEPSRTNKKENESVIA